MKTIFIQLLLLWAYSPSIAQFQNNYWYFGNRAAIVFDNGLPTPLTTSQMVSVEGCASVSDASTGALLFYTNGISLWDANNTVMPNGNGLLAGSATSSTQAVLIVPLPGQSSKYAVLTTDETSNAGANGFRYSIVDMTLNGGLGDVVANQKNILIQVNTTERIAAAPLSDGTGYWISIHERNNSIFKSYKLTSTGIDPVPVISNVGAIHSTNPQPNGDATQGYLKFNHLYNKAAVALYAANKIEVFDFDACTGVFSNPLTINTLDNPYGLEFSPDNTKLYYSLYYNAGLNGLIYQVNLQAPNPATSAVLVGLSSSINNQAVGALQLAPDGKIYIAINSEDWLSAIDQPNNLGASCNFIDKAVVLPAIGLFPTTGIFGLPPNVLAPISPNEPVAANILAADICLGDSSLFSIEPAVGLSSIRWDFGDASTANDTSTRNSPAYAYAAPGIYTIQALVDYACTSDTLDAVVVVTDCDTSTNVCALAFPDAFSPNADGLNDLFRAVTDCGFVDYELTVFNRWGTLLFTTTATDLSWDGSFAGKPQPRDVYLYTLRYQREGSTNMEFLRGELMLLR